MPAVPSRLYALLHRLPRPASYTGRLLFIAFIGTHVPLLGLLGYVILSERTFAAALPMLGVALVMTLVGTALTLWGLHAMLSPIQATAQSLRQFADHGTSPALPTTFTDEAGTLMADTQHTLLHLEKLLGFKNRIIGVISHDVRTPASSIQMACDMLVREIDSEAPRASVTNKMLGIIDSSVRHQLELVDALLALAQHDEAKLTLTPSTARADRLIRDLTRQIKLLAVRKQIQLRHTVDLPELLTLHTDIGKLRQVLHNLLTNAIKYTPAGGEVTLSLFARKDTVVFQVKDTGIGIDAEVEKALYEPFSEHRPGTHNESGTGLGLWICHAFTDLLGGTIEVESTPNVGTTFQLLFPRKTLSAAEAHATASTPNSSARS